MQRDPLECATTPTDYRYGFNSPQSWVDPEGLKPIVIKYKKGATAGEAKENAKKAVEAYNKEHPNDPVDPSVADKIGNVTSKDAQGNPVRWVGGVTRQAVRCKRVIALTRAENGEITKVEEQSVAERQGDSVRVLPDDGSLDDHEQGHLDVTDKVIEDWNAKEGAEKRDVTEKTEGEKRQDNNKKSKEPSDKSREANDEYDKKTDHGQAEKQKEWRKGTSHTHG